MKINLNKAYLLLGLFFVSFNIFSQNQRIADSLLLLYENGQFETVEELEILHDIAFNSTKPKERLNYSNKLIELSKGDSNFIWLHRGYQQRGNSYRLSGDYDKAINDMFQSAKYAKKANYFAGIGTAYTSIGDAYSSNSNYKAIVEFRKLGDSLKLAITLLNLGEGYYRQDKIDSAMTYLLESKEIFQQKNYEIGIAYALGNIGLVYAKLGMNDLAESHINQATAELEELGDKYPIAVYQTYMADIYRKKGDLNTALKYAKKSLEMAEEEGLKEQIRDASLKLSELYESSNNFQQAYLYQSQYLAYRDSINNESTIRKIADIRTEYEVSKKQAEVDTLNKEARTQNIILVGLLVILALLMVLIYVRYKIYLLKAKANQTLEKRNKLIENQRNQLDALNQTKDRFFSIVSHDLRGPVSSFQGVSELLKDMVEHKDYQQMESVTERLEKSARQLSLLLDNLLGWALGQQGQFPYRPEKLALADVFDSTLGVLENMALTKNQKLTYELDKELDIHADRDSTLAIFRNLIGNAIKFTPENGSIDFNAERDGNMVQLKVSDSGVGISKEKLTGIFNFEGNKSSWGTRGEKGMGLGLILVHEFVDMNKGRITMDSEEGEGTTVTVWLPIFDELKRMESFKKSTPS